MKQRITSLLITLVLLVAIVPAAGAASEVVTLDAIADTTGGSAVTISGSTSLDEVNIKLLRPNSTILYFNIVPATNGAFSDTITLGDSEPTGTYTVVAGQGTKIATTTFSVSAGQSGNNGGGGMFAGSFEPTSTTNGKLTLAAGQAGDTSLGQEVTVTIPRGATDKRLEITIEKLLNTANLANHGEVFASAVFEILKNFSDNFLKPVKLTFKFDTSKVKEGQRASVFYFDEQKQEWIELGGMISGDTITVETNHFTKFAVLVVGEKTEPSVRFSDISGHWAENKIAQAVELGIVKGYTDGTFKPNATVTRAEFAVMLANAMNLSGDGATLAGFSDSAKIAAWAKTSVAQAVEAGFITGYEDMTFRPAAEITRVQLAAMIARAYSADLAKVDTTGFADDASIATWAKSAVYAVKQLGIIQGKGSNRFAPNDTATRAEAVTMLINLLDAKQ
ncbi:S-layer homology domain-containing protein [Paenibacillus chungangensis]|uniref:S-layer homology domain-containing protein n=1 Tax=Paenibacillus chungangensis TaxID=696535 RepID=A0ABW3HUW3_9BACL